MSENRAAAARYYLIKKGVRSSRLETISMGKRDPETPNTNEYNRELNRKVVFVVAE